MSDHLRIPFQQSMDKAINRQIMEAIQRLGSALPCKLKSVDGPIATVEILVDGFNFPPIQCPINQSKYVREPFQEGDEGVVFPVSVYIGNISGLGGSEQSTYTEQANLSTLMFFACGSTGYQSTDSDKVVVRGPGGVKVGSLSGGATIVADASGITITNGTITLTGGDIVADGVSLKNHITSLVVPGSGVSGPPVP